MSDKTEYSRLLLKRTGTPGVVPTIPTGNTLSTFIDTDTFIGEIFVNVDDDNAWIRTNNGQIPILVSGSTAASLASTLLVGNQTGAIDIEIDSNQVIRNPLSLTPDDAYISVGTTARPNEIRLQSADLSTNLLANVVIDNSQIQMSSNDATATTTALISCSTNGGSVYDFSDIGGNVNISSSLLPNPQLFFSTFNNPTFQTSTYLLSDTLHTFQSQDPTLTTTQTLTLSAPGFFTQAINVGATSTSNISSDTTTGNRLQTQDTKLSTSTQIDMSLATGDVSIICSGDLTFAPANGDMIFSNLPAFANQAAAVAGGKVTGDVYRTNGAGAAPLNVAGIVMVVV